LQEFLAKFKLWDHFLWIFGNPNEISDLAVRRVIVGGLVLALEVFLEADSAPELPPSRDAKPRPLLRRQFLPQGNVLLEIFGPCLFDSILLPYQRDAPLSTLQSLHDLKTVAYTAICRICLSRSEVPIKQSHLANLYYALRLGLEVQQSMEWVLLRLGRESIPRAVASPSFQHHHQSV